MEEPKLIRKNYKDIVRQKKVLIGMSIFVLIVLIAPSYALLSNFKKLDNAVNIKSANMNMGITQSSTISLEGKLPESDPSGLENANPVSITVKNANQGPFTNTENTKFQNTSPSTIKIVKYELKLVPDTSDSNKITTLDNQYIKYAISTDNGTSYSTPKTLTDSNTIIFTGYNLDLGATKDIKLKIWIDENAGQNGINKNYYGAITVEMYQNATVPAGEVVRANIKSNNTSSTCQNATLTYTEDGITYISGSKTCIDFNYLWYSGKMWRITAIYPDGAMKLVTDNNITSIAFNESGQLNFYTDENTKSYMYQWLNEDFYDTLYHASEFIDAGKQWNATMPDNTDISTKPGNTNLVTANVGLLNSYEYYNSYRCNGSSACSGSTYSSGYLNIGYSWWLLNPYNTSNVWNVNSYGNGNNNSPTYQNGGRPSIIIKSELSLTGEGTSNSPYKIVGDKSVGVENEYINNRLSGEYVRLSNGSNNQTFRIVGIEDNKTKIVAMDYADSGASRKFATSTGSANTLWGRGTTTDADTWYTYLNSTYFPTLVSTYDSANAPFVSGTYEGLFANGTYYFGTSGYNYKLSICANTTSGNTKVCDKTTQVLPNSTNTNPVYIGLLRYGEMFATQQSWGSQTKKSMWLINRYSPSYVWLVTSYGDGYSNSPTNTYGGRPSIHLSSNVKILSGTGLPNDPYVVGM